MILIADSGSTKCNWALCNRNGGILNRYHTIGFNPYFIEEKDILSHLKKSDLVNYQDNITKIIFYGAGCSSKEKNMVILNPFKLFFKNADIIIKHDIEAACYAVYSGNPNITCILGTGSNSCFFDGEKILEHAPSLGFLIGDEASGNYFGKKLINLYFNKMLPQDLRSNFETDFETNLTTIQEKIYNNSRANVYLAKFFPFISKNKTHPLIKDLINKSLDDFFKIHVCCFRNYKETEINFIGSVAYYLSDQIHAIARIHNCTINTIIKDPLENLVSHHFKYS
tara:strand:- start:977 stop:1822 length:846 start_codon:yes stop_codon:yes gene_type:complete